MQAWASWVNSHGGLAGHQVHLVVLDDGYSAAKALANAQTAINQDHAVAIFDNSDEDPSFASVVETANVPVLGGQETESGWQNSDFFPAGATFNYTNSVGAIIAKNAGVKKIAALYCVEVTICAESVQQGKQVASHYGIKYVYTAGIGFAAPNYTAQCLAAKQSGATAMTVGDASSVVEHVVQDCAAQGLLTAPVLERRDGRRRLADDPGLQREHRLPVGFPVVRPQLGHGDDVQGARQVRAASAQRAELR